MGVGKWVPLSVALTVYRHILGVYGMFDKPPKRVTWKGIGQQGATCSVRGFRALFLEAFSDVGVHMG